MSVISYLKDVVLIGKFYQSLGLDGIRIFFAEKLAKKKIYTFKTKSFKHPIYLRPHTSDFSTFIQMIIDQDYSVDYGDLKPNVIIDCGANIGLGTLMFKKLFPGAHIYAVEPEEENFSLLCKNTQQYDNITCLKYGIWNKDTFLNIKDPGLGSWGFMIEEADRPNQHSIPSISISSLMKAHKVEQIDILKIDIEGSEKEVFSEDCDYWLSRTKVLIIELHDRLRAGGAVSLFKALSKYNFSFLISGENLIFFMKH